MTGGIAPLADWHTHSDLTDGEASAEAMADAAADAGLTLWGLSDHVRASTTWLFEYVTATRRIRRDGMHVRCGVEAKLLDKAGRLDLPATLPRLDYVLVADHQFPGRDGPEHPATIRTALEAGTMRASDVVSDLVTATISGVRRSPSLPIVAHLFSLLPKMGLSEDDVSDAHLQALASACVHAGGAVEINEKWRCPSARSIAYLARAGVAITSGSDAHSVEEVGRRDYFEIVMTALEAQPAPVSSGSRPILIDHP